MFFTMPEWVMKASAVHVEQTVKTDHRTIWMDWDWEQSELERAVRPEDYRFKTTPLHRNELAGSWEASNDAWRNYVFRAANVGIRNDIWMARLGQSTPKQRSH
jgi:hypothetical protein